MEFLILVACYLGGLAAALFLYLFRDKPFMEFSIHLVSKVLRVFPRIFPEWLKMQCRKLIDDWIFHRNHIFQVLYIIMVLGGHTVLFVDSLHFMYLSNPDRNHALLPVVLLVGSTAAFIILCRSDPGVITSDKHTLCLQLYKYDDVMYKPSVKCTSCHFVKPARSKHCAIYDKCIYKYDHYCVWVNNAIGGLNHRYFLMFTISLCITIINAIHMTVHALMVVTAMHQFMEAKYFDANGDLHEMTYRVLVQTLFMRFPRMVLLLVYLLAILLALGGFTLYHSYLACTNQTTNERYKKHRLNYKHIRNPYDNGLIQNITEECFPSWQRKTIKRN